MNNQISKLNNLLEEFYDVNPFQLYTMMKYCNDNKLYKLGTFFEKYLPIMNVSALYLMFVFYVETFNYDKAYKIGIRLINSPTLSSVYDELFDRLMCCVEHVKDTYLHPFSRINSIRQKAGIVTFTITTCKRYELFVKTMNSFLNCCKDIDLISRWICVDDNSSDLDRKRMKENYPFFEFVFKDKSTKGHPKSMNILRDMIRTPLYFHIEDDWHFICERPYISDCIKVLSESETYSQCLLNRNYSEIASNRIKGGYVKYTNEFNSIGFNSIESVPIRYRVHEYYTNDEEKNAFIQKYGNVSSCAYWPGFSFRPSLVRTDVLRKVGPFNETIKHFELEYSWRVQKLKYDSVFLDSIHCLHTGRLTTEIHDNSKLNAYILNDEKQFDDKTSLGYETYVINLKRREDRWNVFKQKNRDINVIRYEAIDGNELKSSVQLQRIFDGNDYRMRKGMVGCAMSHIDLCIKLLNSNCNMYCILEDDAELASNFALAFNTLIQSISNVDWDIIYLGHHLYPQYITSETYDINTPPRIEKWNKERSLLQSLGGTTGYLINKKGANKLLQFINTHGMKNGIDTMQQKSADELEIYYYMPHLVKADCYNINLNADSDIQKCFDSLSETIESRINQELKFYENSNHIHTSECCYEDIDTKYRTYNVILYDNTVENVLKLSHSIKTKTQYFYYTLNNQFLVIIKQPTSHHLNNRYFDRLKKNGVYDIQDCFRQ